MVRESYRKVLRHLWRGTMSRAVERRMSRMEHPNEMGEGNFSNRQDRELRWALRCWNLQAMGEKVEGELTGANSLFVPLGSRHLLQEESPSRHQGDQGLRS